MYVVVKALEFCLPRSICLNWFSCTLSWRIYQDFSWNVMIMIIIKNQFDRKETRDNPEGINLLILKQIKDHEHILHSKPPHSWPNQLFFSDSCLCVVKLSATSLKACYHKNTFKRTIIWSHFSHFHSYMNSSNKNQV